LTPPLTNCFSALQRAEIAEIGKRMIAQTLHPFGFSALQRAEIAEIETETLLAVLDDWFQCSSTSRNC